MACYWGFETTGNKVAWGLVLLFVLLGAAFFFPGIIEMKKCMQKHTTCMCRATPSGGWVCADSSRDPDTTAACTAEYVSCRRTPAVVWSIGWLFLALLSWAPCCYFCCCSRNPKEIYQQQQGGVQMGVMPGVPPTAQVYQYPGHYQQQQHYTAGAVVPGFAPTLSGPALQQQQYSAGYALPPQQSFGVDTGPPVHRH